ncbi:MAG: 50S ribosomal protein L32 [Patescibacteria group bacterium]|nr:50S ribosomal protein L32 [Patescibacteria group bacterium]
MSVPKQKKTSSQRKQRAQHLKLKPTKLTSCPKCQHPVKPHHVCKFCGTYADKKILDIKLKKLSKNEKAEVKNLDKKNTPAKKKK